ncbi:MAG: hypothetical protein N3J91_07250 [Verrucomicrobiae bacterium]|nr:hypothetical protein [Verrucomicrobiae bacterium]
MKKFYALLGAALGAAVLALPAAEPGPAFQIVTEQTVCPEYGTVMYRRALLCEGLRLAFQPPAGWKASADAGQRVLLLESPTADAQIRLRLVLPRRENTNAPAVLPPAPELKAVVAGIAAGAEITAEGEYPAAGRVGKSLDFNFVQGARRYQGRVVWVTLPECHLELVLTTSNNLAKKHPFFIELLNSLEVRKLQELSQVSR